MVQAFLPEDVQAAFASVLVDEWARGGVTDAVACPGSRSSPLLVALAEAEESGRLRLHVLLDERAAGFFALGLARASGMPAPVVTTSGTASVELHPAVVEAYHAGVPMVVVTADRPPELHGWGSPQTIDQVGLFGRAVRWEASPGVPEPATAGTWRSLASRALWEALGGARRPGPVHLNLAFREPLTGRADAFLGAAVGASGSSGPGLPPPGSVAASPGLPPPGSASSFVPPPSGPGSPWPGPAGSGAAAAGSPRLRMVAVSRSGGRPWHSVSTPAEAAPPRDIVEALAAAGRRGLVVAGAGAGDPAAVRALSESMGWPVLADPLSGCRFEGAVCAADALLRVQAVREWRPDVVLRLGAPWASRVVNEWLGTLDCPQWLVSRWGEWAAPDRLPSQVMAASPSALCWAVARVGRSGASVERAATDAGCRWAGQWTDAERAAQSAIDAVLAADGSLSGPAVARTLAAVLPGGSALVVASSMPVRHVEWWSQPREDLRVYANRGANGIDGVLSTALGIATAARGRGGPGGENGEAGRAASGRARRLAGGGFGKAPAAASASPLTPADKLGAAPGALSESAVKPGGRPRVVALLGDLAFVYDASALLWTRGRPLQLDVVVVDNAGGGIFDFLPQAASQPPARFERLWGTPHGLDLVQVAQSYGAHGQAVDDLSFLARAVSGGGADGEENVRVWVVKVSRRKEVDLHRSLWAAVAAAASG
jgi:2-succinyl-5-enolpyruvyl-6-hydroxy-3-cyclohexene-1-carboxylate synthase